MSFVCRTEIVVIIIIQVLFVADLRRRAVIVGVVLQVVLLMRMVLQVRVMRVMWMMMMTVVAIEGGSHGLHVGSEVRDTCCCG